MLKWMANVDMNDLVRHILYWDKHWHCWTKILSCDVWPSMRDCEGERQWRRCYITV